MERSRVIPVLARRARDCDVTGNVARRGSTLSRHRKYRSVQVTCDVTGSGDEGGVTVKEDVDEEDDVDDAVCRQLSDVVDRLAVKRGVVGHHDGRVVSKNEDQPVPDTAEPRVMQHNVLWSDGRRRAVLRYRRLSIECRLKHHSAHTAVLF